MPYIIKNMSRITFSISHKVKAFPLKAMPNELNLLEKVSFNLLIWKYIKKRTLNFINQFFLCLFKNILKYIQLFITQIIISWSDHFTW